MPQQLKIVASPVEEFEIPASDGYQLYSSLLNIMQSSNKEISNHTHDSLISSISLSMLKGPFKKSKRAKYKIVYPEYEYDFTIGITDPKEIEIFKTIIKPLILSEENIPLNNNILNIKEVSSSDVSFEEIVGSVIEYSKPTISFHFSTPTNIQYKNSKVSEMFPHREAVFNSLLSKWNSVCPVELKMNIERDEMARYIMERPYPSSYTTHSVMVNTVFDKFKGHYRPILKHGFTGKCSYIFTNDAPKDLKNAILILSKFAEYSGVGSAVSRGCGCVNINIYEGK